MITSPRKLCVGGVNAGITAGCYSAHFNTRGVKFQHICGQSKSYQKGTPDALEETKELMKYKLMEYPLL